MDTDTVMAVVMLVYIKVRGERGSGHEKNPAPKDCNPGAGF